jgi:hypothetical protein
MLTAVTRKHAQIVKRLQSDSLDRSQDDAVLVEAADEGWTAVLSASLPLTRDHEQSRHPCHYIELPAIHAVVHAF